jgi:DNA-binding CsgD family transcriptional regulator
MTPLTPRQREIVGLLASGLTAKETALRLCISQGSVSRQLELLRAAFGCSTSLQLFCELTRRGLVG